MKALVSGAAGFIGSHLCERLISDGHTVVGVDDLSTGRLSNLESIKQHPNFHFRSLDVTTPGIVKAMEGVDVYFHLAALADIVPSIEAPIKYHNVNVTGTIAALEAARQACVKRFVYAASSSCYGIPSMYPTPESYPCVPKYPYAQTKYLGEQYVNHWNRCYGLSTISLRLFNVYGPRHRTSGAYGAVFGTFLAQLANNSPCTVVGDGNQTRDFTFVSDVVDALAKAGYGSQNGVFNIGSGGTYSINSLLENLGAKEVVHLPKRPGEPDCTFGDTDRFCRAFDWQPKVSFEEGCAIMKELIPQYKSAPLWTEEKIKEATKTWFKYMGEKEE